MSDRLDVLKSFVRQARDRAGHRLGRLGPVAALRKAVETLKQQKAVIPDEAITNALAHAPGVVSASASADGGAVRVDATFEDGESLQLAFVPVAVRFAPHGAKEVTLRIEPAELARDRRALGLAASLCGLMAQAVFRLALPVTDDDVAGAIVDREGDDLVRVDLRTVPVVRRLTASRTPVAMILEVFEIAAIEADGGALSLRLRVPALG